ncbi:hypothetical protein QAD02_018367 [Eretmocerus hayati]|uniref:Uncharacterized protein n=1 Tax=Eretmocerus hayati TaxID=131215 RepID=A0ACC2PLC5_9HYME|nr:hypothetical protein QAD02_018367 [Eretmocerus hayati]
MSGKNLINAVEDIVNESLIGYTFAYPHLELHASKRVVLKSGWRKVSEKVSVVSGGGSGHEPFTSGFVGSGMLSASVSGSIYAAPPSSHILHAIQCVSMNNKNAGCLVIIPNYTGDCLNFGLAIEEAKRLGLKVSQVVVEDDCSIPECELGRAGKRALPGIVLVIKVAGAMAEKGCSLDEVTKFTQTVCDNVASCSVGLTVCTVPGQGRMFELANDEVELGQGLHGEAGYKRMKLTTANEIVSELLERIKKASKVTSGDSVAILINNFGGLSQLEQGVVVKEVVTQLRTVGITPVRVYCGLLMTSLDGAGITISLLKLPESERELILDCLDDRTEAPRWPGCSYSLPASNYQDDTNFESFEEKCSEDGPRLREDQGKMLKRCLQNACLAIIAKEKVINELDGGCGDGDCGTTHKHLAEGILLAINDLDLEHPSLLLSQLAKIAEDRMGGTSGALYSLMFTAASAELSKIDKNRQDWSKIWALTCRAGLNGIMKYSKARLGDKTMIDVLEPSLRRFEENLSLPPAEVGKLVATCALESAESTKNLIPRAGRASYVKQAEYLKGVDAGAFAVATWINAVVKTL